MTRNVAQWDVFELELAGPNTGNPFIEVELHAEFRYEHRVLTTERFLRRRWRLPHPLHAR